MLMLFQFKEKNMSKTSDRKAQTLVMKKYNIYI